MKKMIALCLSTLACSLVPFFYRVFTEDPSVVTIYQGSTYTLPHNCPNLGLLGCTPHPSAYLKKLAAENSASVSKLDLSKLMLTDFINLDDLKDSFTETLLLAKTHKIDHILIAYLPVYFIATKRLIKQDAAKRIQSFLISCGNQIGELVKKLQEELSIFIPITIVLPTKQALNKIPSDFVSDDEYVRCLIKQFPRLAGFENSNLKTITIINTSDDAGQNAPIINLLKYEYLFERPLEYREISTRKKRFHSYKHSR
jgi:hypothetical protein